MILKEFKGLNLQSNSFKNNAGYLERAQNILISRDNIIQKRNGYSTFYGAPASTPLALADYKNKLILIGSTYIDRIDQTAGGVFDSANPLSGQTVSISNPRNAQAAGNLFVATDNFILKLEGTSTALLKAGVPKAPDLTYLPFGSGTVIDAVAGIHAPDSQIGYRVVFGRKDANSNLVLGAPSELTQNTNALIASSAVGLASYIVTITSVAHGLLVNDFVTIRSSNGSVAVPDGEYTVTTVPTADTFTIDTAAVLSTPPVGVTSLSFGIRRKPKIELTIPSGVDTTFLYRVYRTNASLSNDVEPDESTLQLINEVNVSSAEITAGYIQFTDTVDDLFKTAFLYTNPNTGEGINEANFQPPVAQDIAAFKNHMFFAYPTTFYSKSIALIRASASTFANGDYVDAIQTDKLRTATASTWQSGTTVRYAMAAVTSLQVGQYVLFTLFVNSANNGKFIITSVGVGYVECTNAGRTDATLNESAVTAKAYPIRRYTAAAANSYNTAAGGNFLLTTSSPSVASNIDTTARSLCKVVNRDTYSNCYASYTSTSQSLPGQMFFYSRVVTDITALQASSATVGANFDPVLPNTVTDLTCITTNNVYPNGIFVSKEDEYEAVPLTSFILVGSKDAAILRIMPLKNSLIILKEDGVFSLRGTNRSDFSVIPLDTSVFCNAPESAVELNGFIYVLTLSGVVQISETNVSIQSRNIEPLLTNIFTDADFADNTFASSIEDERLYLLTTITPNNGDSVTYCYNVITNVWTSWDKLFKRGVVKRSDNTHYAITTSNILLKMRKTSTKTDFCDESATVISISSVAADTLSCDVVSPLSLTAGDVLIFSDTINRILSISGSTVTFSNNINFIAGDLPVHYKAITSSVLLSPVSPEEDYIYQWQSFSMNFRNQACSTLDIGFVSDCSEAEFQNWTSSLTQGGWGDLPWGLFEWGLSETTTIDLGTYAASPVEEFIPIECQISTWLQLKFEHSQAAENINLQAVGFRTRKISDRIAS